MYYDSALSPSTGGHGHRTGNALPVGLALLSIATAAVVAVQTTGTTLLHVRPPATSLETHAHGAHAVRPNTVRAIRAHAPRPSVIGHQDLRSTALADVAPQALALPHPQPSPMAAAHALPLAVWLAPLIGACALLWRAVRGPQPGFALAAAGPVLPSSLFPRAAPRCPPLRSTATDEGLVVDVDRLPDTIPGEAPPAQPGDLPPDVLIKLAKNLVNSRIGSNDPKLLSDGFYFMAPFVGPLGKEQFLRIFSVVTFDDAFPDLAENNFGWTVDPLQPNRVWFMNRLQGTHTGTFVGLGMEVPATGNRVELPPTANSATFNARGQCVKFTTGYVVDREDGTTGGVSALFGILKGIGRPLPFPEAQSYQPSWQFRLFQFLGSLGARAANKD